MNQVFISYRRMDSQAISDRIYERLADEFGASTIFKDVDDIPPGADFPTFLDQQVKDATVILVIIGRYWTNVAYGDGSLRLDDPADFVRIEVEHAMSKQDTLLIPVLVNNAPMPEPTQLPDSLKPILRLNAMQVRNDPDFRNDIERLIRKLHGVGIKKQRNLLIPGIAATFIITLLFVAIFIITNLPDSGTTDGTQQADDFEVASASTTEATNIPNIETDSETEIVDTPIPDSDGDGILDTEDVCLDVRGSRDNQGCPDSDGDTMHDGADSCPFEGDEGYGIDAQGCPNDPVDSDQDGIFDNNDSCWTQGDAGNGVDSEGCPNPVTGEGSFALGDVASRYNINGQTVTIVGPWLGADEEAFNKVILPFEVATGADVIYTGTDAVEQVLTVEVAAGAPSNIGLFPNMLLADDFAGGGQLTPLSDDMQNLVLSNMVAGQSWLDMATFADKDNNEHPYGVYFGSQLTMLVWYVPDNFVDAGYEIPVTMEELINLSDQIVVDGGTPWCIGLESGGASGWPATRWVNEMLLRTAEPEIHDAWIAHEISFDHPSIVNAIELFGFFARNDDYVSGGVSSVISTSFADAADGLFSAPSNCYMHFQGSFIPAFFPEDIEVGSDVDFFYLPPLESEPYGRPVLVTTTMAAILDDSPAAQAFMEYLVTPEAHEIWVSETVNVSQLLSVDRDFYDTPLQRGQAEILLSATTVRTVAADLMPGSIRAGAFWTGMLDYVAGNLTAEDVTAEIEAIWQETEASGD